MGGGGGEEDEQGATGSPAGLGARPRSAAQRRHFPPVDFNVDKLLILSCLQHHHRSKWGEAVNGTFTFCREGDMH